MSVTFCTGFNGLTTAQVDRRFAYSSTAVIGATGRYGQGCTIADPDFIYTPITAAHATTLYMGMSFKPVSFAGGPNVLLFDCYDDANAVTHVSVKYDAANERLLVVNEATSTTEYTGVSGSVPVGSWYVVEAMVTVHDTTGAITLRLNGKTLYTGTVLDTRNTAGSPYGIQSVGMLVAGTGSFVVDGLYLSDSGFQGAFRVDAVVPSADGSSIQFTPLSSTNESNVDDGNTPDDDTTYTESATNGHRDLFSVSGFTAPTHIPAAAVVWTMVKASAADGRAVAASLRSGGSTLTGTGVTLTTAYAEAAYVVAGTTYETIAAAQAAINALEIGYAVTA